jgi:hypothetical protein
MTLPSFLLALGVAKMRLIALNKKKNNRTKISSAKSECNFEKEPAL